MSRYERMINCLQSLNPLEYKLTDDSHQHSVPKGAESHFTLVLVSEQFSGLSLVARHRLVNQLFIDEFQQGLHALSLHLYTPLEWAKKQGNVPDAPKCLGGKKREG